MLSTEWRNGFEDISHALMIRRKVFIEEMREPENVEMDGLDEASMHIVLYDDGIPVASGRVLWDDGQFRLGHIAVLPAYRGQKFGDFIVRLMIRKAYESGGQSQLVEARANAVGFYERLGFVPQGEAYGYPSIPGLIITPMVHHGDIFCYC